PGDPAAGQQPAAVDRLRDGPARHALPAAGRRAGAGQDLGRPALLLAPVHPADGAVGGTGALRSADALAARPALAGGRDAAAVAGGGTGWRGHRLLPRTAGSVEGRGRDRRRAVGGPGNGTLRLVAAAPGQWQPWPTHACDVGHG